MQEPAGLAGAGAAPAVAQPPFHWSQQPQDLARPQRRTKAGRLVSTITKEELESCFHMPSEQACRHLGVGLTILKRVCRRFGIPRWPYNRQGRPEDGGIPESNGIYGNGGQQGSYGFGPAAGPGAGAQPFTQPFAPQLQAPQHHHPAHSHAPSAGAAGAQQSDWQQQQLQQALSSLFPQQRQQQQQQAQQQPIGLAAQPAGLAPPAGLPVRGQQDSNQLLQATIAALQSAPPGTLSSPAVQSLLSSLLGGALGGALAAGLGQQAPAAPAPPAPAQWGSLLPLSQPAALPPGRAAAPGGNALQQLVALLQQPAPGRSASAPVHPQPQPSNPVTASALLSALGAGAAQSQPAARPAAAARAGSGSLDVLAVAADGKLGGAAGSPGAAPSKPASAQQDTDGWGDSGGDSQGEEDDDLADFLEPGAQLPPRAGAAATAHPPAAAAPLPLAPAAAPPAASQAPAVQPPAATAASAPPAAEPQLEPLERQLLAALPDLRETAGLLRQAAAQLQSHLLAQRLLKERTAALGAHLPGSCQLLGVNAELAELCCTTLLTLLDGEGGAMAAALQAAAQKQSNGSGSGAAPGSGDRAALPAEGSLPLQPGSSTGVKHEESHLTGQGSPKRPRCDSPAAALQH